VVGEGTLRDLVREAEANELAFRAQVRTVLRGSYSGHYRRMLGPLLAALEFRSNNAAFRPVIDALDLLARYAHVDGKRRFYGPEARVPLDGVVPAAWRDAVVDDQGRVDRIPYELCVLVALRDAIRRREIYAEGATRWRDPEEDLPGDFEASRDVHYGALRQPMDPSEFVVSLQQRMRAAPGPARREAGRWRRRRGAGRHATRRSVDQRAQARGVARAADARRAQGRGRSALGHPGPAQRAEGERVPDRVHARARRLAESA
jgi:hypothetical protein